MNYRTVASRRIDATKHLGRICKPLPHLSEGQVSPVRMPKPDEGHLRKLQESTLVGTEAKPLRKTLTTH